MKYFKQNLADICAQGAVFKDAEFDNCEIGL